MAAKNSGVVRLAVASQATALAPFSQNSNEDVCFGSGQAQPGQSKPCGWFMLRRPLRLLDDRLLATNGICYRLQRTPSGGGSFVVADARDFVLTHVRSPWCVVATRERSRIGRMFSAKG